MEASVNRIKGYLKTLQSNIYGKEYAVPTIYVKRIGYGERATVFQKVTEPGFEIFENASKFGGSDTHAVFKTTFTIDEGMVDKEIWMQLQTGATDIWNTDNPQFLIYLNDEIVCGMDMNHHEVCLTKKGTLGEKIEIAVYAYSNSECQTDYFRLLFLEKHSDVEALYYDVKVPFEIALEQREDTIERIKLLEVLDQAVTKTDLRIVPSEAFYKSVKEVSLFLKENFYDRLSSDYPVTVHSIGHTHIDVAWKWPVRQTREKVLRSFATVLKNMEDYPEYRFMSSQPQLYQFVKEEEPSLFEKIKEKIKEGRWEAEGAMWLEADCNLTSGESLIRQLLKGKAFFENELGAKKQRVLWLPDVFGYSAALPQLLKKSGIEYFMTTKIAWNEKNKMPHDVMLWKGIDGSEVLTYFISTADNKPYPELIKNPRFETTYNGRQNPTQVIGTWQRFSDKELTDDVLTCYGFGDGGGGPTREMLENDKRISKGIPGCPVTKQTFSAEFFDILKANLEKAKRDGKPIPKWAGELYLEYHRGTYTSQAKNKKYNRLCEYKNEDAEWMLIMSSLKSENPKLINHEALDRLWKLTLLNQFHDILPGSSIAEVYEVSGREYEEILSEDERLISEAARTIIGKGGENTAVFNPCPFESDALIETENGPVRVERIPAKGIKVVNLNSNVHKESEFSFDKNTKTLQTPFYQLQFNEAYEICSLFDKRFSREVILEGEVFNRILAFEDRPWEYDAWNIDSYYEMKKWNVDDVSEVSVLETSGERFTLRVKRKYLNSVISQDIMFYANSPRIDFKTEIDWAEHQTLLKAEFPVDVVTNKCTCDIQFGNVERPTHRNTSWDEARFEFAAHKWVDVSEAGYGVALLNDCKYGYDVNESTMRITLLKSGIFPDPNADLGHHEFTYSLLPHEGDFRKGNVIKEAYKLNRRIFTMDTALPEGAVFEMFTVDKENVLLDTIKPSEDGRGIIIRLHEEFGKRTCAKIDLSAMNIRFASACDLMERELAGEEAKLENGVLTVNIKPYEILTYRLY